MTFVFCVNFFSFRSSWLLLVCRVTKEAKNSCAANCVWMLISSHEASGRSTTCSFHLLTFHCSSFVVALQALKRKKRYEQQLEQLQGTLTTIETQREALENANTNAAVLDTMKGAADALKKTHKDMNVDNVHEMMDDIAEQNDVANEISNAISTGIIGSQVDDDDLAKELEELEQEELDKDLLNVGPATSKLPDVPSTDLPTTSKDKEKKKGSFESSETLTV